MSTVKKPEPVGYFAYNPETLKPEWSEDCVCQDNIYEPDETGTVGRPFVFADQAEAYANALAAEREQKTVDSIIDVIGDCHIDNHQLTEITERIRALIPKQ